MTKNSRFTSEQTEIVKLKTNYLLSGDWWAFTVSLPLRHGLAAGLCVFGMVYGFLLALVLADKLEVQHGLFVLTSGSFGLGVAAYTFIARSVAYVEIIARPESETVTTTPVVFDDIQEPQQEVKEWVKTDNGLWAINYPLTTAQIDHLKSVVTLGQRFTRDKLKSPAFNGFNLTENYPQLLNALHDCGALDEQNNWTTAGVEWAKGE